MELKRRMQERREKERDEEKKELDQIKLTDAEIKHILKYVASNALRGGKNRGIKDDSITNDKLRKLQKMGLLKMPNSVQAASSFGFTHYLTKKGEKFLNEASLLNQYDLSPDSKYTGPKPTHYCIKPVLSDSGRVLVQKEQHCVWDPEDHIMFDIYGACEILLTDEELAEHFAPIDMGQEVIQDAEEFFNEARKSKPDLEWEEIIRKKKLATFQNSRNLIAISKVKEWRSKNGGKCINSKDFSDIYADAEGYHYRMPHYICLFDEKGNFIETVPTSFFAGGGAYNYINVENIDPATTTMPNAEEFFEASTKIIGRTQSGKPVYIDKDHYTYKDFDENDHNDASRFHAAWANAFKSDKHKYQTHMNFSNSHKAMVTTLKNSKNLLAIARVRKWRDENVPDEMTQATVFDRARKLPKMPIVADGEGYHIKVSPKHGTDYYRFDNDGKYIDIVPNSYYFNKPEKITHYSVENLADSSNRNIQSTEEFFESFIDRRNLQHE